MIVHLIDGTYEWFRHFYGLRRGNKGIDAPYGAVRGVLMTVLKMIEDGATHVGMATDHVIESFWNDLWPGYKTGGGIEPVLWNQFGPLEEALAVMGDFWGCPSDAVNEFHTLFRYSAVEGFSDDGFVSRCDPSKVIRVDGR